MNPPIEGAPEHGSNEWREWRRRGIGASEVGAACGVSKWKTRYQLWLDKTGRSAPVAETPAMRWGKRHEQGLVEDWTEINCYSVEEYPGLARQWVGQIFATPDAIVTSPEGGLELLECKTTTWRNDALGEQGTDEIPHEWILQASVQLAACGLSVCNFAVLVDGREMRSYRVEKSDALLAGIRAKCAEFWGHVDRDEHPPVEWDNSSDIDAFIGQWKPYEGLSATLESGSPGAEHWGRYEWLGKQIAEMEKARKEHRAQFLDCVGSASRVLLPDSREVVATVVKSSGYFVQPKEYVRLSAKKSKGE